MYGIEDFVNKYPSSVAAILKHSFRDHVTPDFPAGSDFGPGPVIQLGLDLFVADESFLSFDGYLMQETVILESLIVFFKLYAGFVGWF